MKKFKTFPFAFVVALLLLAAGPPRPAFADCRGAYMETASMVLVSTTVALPTRLLNSTDGQPCVDILLNWSGTGTKPNNEFLLVQTSSFGFSSSASTGTVRIPAGNSMSDAYSFGEYRGQLWAVVIGTTGAGVAPTVAVIRKK